MLINSETGQYCKPVFFFFFFLCPVLFCLTLINSEIAQTVRLSAPFYLMWSVLGFFFPLQFLFPVPFCLMMFNSEAGQPFSFLCPVLFHIENSRSVRFSVPLCLMLFNFETGQQVSCPCSVLSHVVQFLDWSNSAFFLFLSLLCCSIFGLVNKFVNSLSHFVARC